MVLQYKIPLLPTQATASYDFNDIADGTGVKSFYGCYTDDYSLLVNPLSSNQKEVIATVVYAGDSAFHYSGNITTFSLTEFNLPRTVNGTGHMTCYIKAKLNSGTGLDGAKINAIVYRNSEIISSGNLLITNAGFPVTLNNPAYSGYSGNVTIPIVIPTKTYARGDQFKLGFQFGGTAGDTTSVSYVVGIDPLDRDSTNITPSIATDATTILKADIPFRIDIA